MATGFDRGAAGGGKLARRQRKRFVSHPLRVDERTGPAR
jgi:hypothetical protein